MWFIPVIPLKAKAGGFKNEQFGLHTMILFE